MRATHCRPNSWVGILLRSPEIALARASATQTALGGIRRNNPLLEDEAAVEASFSALNDAVGFLGEVIEGEPLDGAHRRGATLRGIDFLLNLRLHAGHLHWLTDYLHSQSWLLDERVEGQNREHGARRAGGRHPVDAQEPPEHGPARDRVGRKIRVANDKFVTMSHGSQRIE